MQKKRWPSRRWPRRISGCVSSLSLNPGCQKFQQLQQQDRQQRAAVDGHCHLHYAARARQLWEGLAGELVCQESFDLGQFDVAGDEALPYAMRQDEGEPTSAHLLVLFHVLDQSGRGAG